MIGWFYLHTNGSLIFKRELDDTAADIRESPFAVGLWSFNSRDREQAWTILVEALAAGANKDRIDELAKKWTCTDDDALIFAQRIGVRLFMDGDAWCAVTTRFTNLQESTTGFGDTALEALAGLAKELGYKPSKMWGNSFAKLLKRQGDK